MSRNSKKLHTFPDRDDSSFEILALALKFKNSVENKPIAYGQSNYAIENEKREIQF